ncbi:MAG: hypothetical protein COB01_00410 [Lutibacter sp.]|nr:MAG: hypothetical protein COB01_00410 [Lutibacter sp.]
MKNIVYIRSLFFVLLSVFIFNTGFAQKVKKNKVRLKAQYVKVMDSEIYFDISATSKVKRKNIKVANIELNIYNTLEDKKILIGKTITNMKGKSRFSLKDLNSLQQDTITNFYNILITFKGDDTFKKAKKSISFKNAEINAKVITKDSINYISATLTDSSSGEPIQEESLIVQIQRLFRALQIGEEFNYTDDAGTILVPIEEGIPGVNGNLAIEVVLSDSDDYGTVKAIVKAPIGKHIVDESTFDERTMWSARNKTPIFLLIFPNLLIFGVWGLIIYLFINLFKITKS